jgi:hypothetical protein
MKGRDPGDCRHGIYCQKYRLRKTLPPKNDSTAKIRNTRKTIFANPPNEPANPPKPVPKKTDVAEHPEAFGHVGLLVNRPTGTAGLPFI